MISSKAYSNEVMDIIREEREAARAGTIPLTHALCFVLGWQGGTVHQVANALKVVVSDILSADEVKAGDLLRKAQEVKWQECKGDINRLLFKHLNVCVDNLKADYIGHTIPPWLERAAGVAKIAAETLSD